MEGFPTEPAGAASFLVPLLMSFLYKLCGLFTYRLFLHPLRKYPGPILGSMTRWYAAFFVSRGVYHRQVLALHHAYGPIVRIGPNTLSFNAHESYVEIYGVGANNRKHESYSVLSASRYKQNTLSAQNKAFANQKRRVHAQLLSPQRLKRVEQRVIDQINIFVTSLVATPGASSLEKDDTARSWKAPVNLAERCMWLTHDVVTDLAFSKSTDMQTSEQYRHFPGLLKFMSRRAITCLVQPQFYKLKLDRLMLASRITQMKELGSYAWQKTKERLASPDEESEDMFKAMMASSGGKHGVQFEEKDYFVETLLMMGVGVLTSGPTLSSVFSFLVHDSAILERLTTEIRSKFTSIDDIRTGPDLNTCNYLRACCDETMRMVPGIATVLVRVVLEGGMTIAGEHLPEGTIVGSSAHAMHRNPQYFHEPDTFRPERWMSGDDLLPPEARRGFFPFGYGPRACTGVHLALAELHLVVARAVFCYDMRLAKEANCCQASSSGKCTDREFRSFVGLDLVGPLVQFRARA
ncbi:hypothetical protein Q7P36_010282 [Cladosporium allicinum]